MGIGLTLAGLGVSLFSTEEANEARQQALKQRMLQNQLAGTQRALQRQRQLERVISSQNAAIGARGIDPGSASFKAIQEDSFDQYAQDQNADNLSQSFQRRSLMEQSRESNELTGIADISDIFGAAKGLYGANAFSNFSKHHIASRSPIDPGKSLFDYNTYRRWKEQQGGGFL